MAHHQRTTLRNRTARNWDNRTKDLKNAQRLELICDVRTKFFSSRTSWLDDRRWRFEAAKNAARKSARRAFRFLWRNNGKQDSERMLSRSTLLPRDEKNENATT